MLGWGLTGKASAEHGSALRKSEKQNQPPPNLPLGYTKGEGQSFAPSLSRSEGEDWGGVAFERVEPSHARLGPY